MKNQLKRDPFILNYTIEGEGEPLLIIGSADYYPKTFSPELPKRRKLIFADHRGFARADGPYTRDDYTIDVIVEDIEALRKSLHLEQMTLIGHSGHAHLAVAYAKKYPYHVTRLVLIAISPRENHHAANAYFDEHANLTRKALLKSNLAEMRNTFVGRMLAFGPMLWHQYDYDATDLWSNVHVNEEIVSYLWGEVFNTHDLTKDIELIKIPINVVLGKSDFFNPPHLWDAVQSPFMSVHVLERAGHSPQLEDATSFDEILLNTPDEINITLDMVNRLIAQQFPQWSHLPISPIVESGWDNRTFHLGSEMSIRLPSAPEYNRQVLKEQAWLPRLAKALPLPIPTPIAMGAPNQEFPLNWSIYKWLDGVSANQLTLTDDTLNTVALELAAFLRALHQYDPNGAPTPGLHNWWRAAHTSVYDAEAKSLINELSEFIDSKEATALWERAVSSKLEGSPVWVHGDIASGNLLIKDNHLSSVIDFGCMGIGDPACDLTIAWTFFKNTSRELFKQHLPLDANTWARARGWALWKALFEFKHTQDKSSDAARKQMDIINAVIEENVFYEK